MSPSRPRRVRPPNDLAQKVAHLDFKAMARQAAKKAPPLADFDFAGHALPLIAEARTLAAADDLEPLFEIAHDLKGQGSSFAYPLITELFDSICHVIRTEAATGTRRRAFLAVQLDAAEMILRQGLTGEGGNTGTQLMAEIRRTSQRLLAD